MNFLYIYITTTGSSTAFNTASDHRLKENVVDFSDGLETVKRIRPVRFDWKSSGKSCQGFIAHEFKSVLPNAVHGEKDAVDENGQPIYQGMDASFLISALTSAVKELAARVEALEVAVQAVKPTGSS